MLVHSVYLSATEIFQEILTHELAAYPPALFEENDAMRVCKNKATLKNKLKVEVDSGTSILTQSKVYDAAAMIRTLGWPKKGKVSDLLTVLNHQISNLLR